MTPVRYHMGKFPPKAIDYERISPIIGRAGIALGRYDGLLSAIPDSANLLLSPLTTREAVFSLKIEGTRVTMSEVMEIEAGGSPAGVTQSKRDDAVEILNYRQTLWACAHEIERRPISQHMIRQAHAMLMQGVRGKDKSPGEYRIEQNWIGTSGTPIEQAGFIPIAPEHLISGMEVWNIYVNSVSNVSPIIKLAIMHVEFEALHPFLDGNGRLGRLLIPLYLFQEKILSSPSFYMSIYFDEHRHEYQNFMRNVSYNDAWTDWIEFFALGVEKQAIENTKKVMDILKLYSKLKDDIREITHSQYGMKALDFLFRSPIFSTTMFHANSGVPATTGKAVLRKIQQSKLVTVLRQGSGQRPTIFYFKQLVDMIEDKS
jgi:Fic family protein